MIMETTIKERNGKQKRIGFYETEGKVWLVERDKKKHYMKTLKGWGLDNYMYEKLKNDYGLQRVVLTEIRTGKVYECRVETIDENKIFKTFHPHRLQIFIPAIFWKMIDNGKKN